MLDLVIDLLKQAPAYFIDHLKHVARANKNVERRNKCLNQTCHTSHTIGIGDSRIYHGSQPSWRKFSHLASTKKNKRHAWQFAHRDDQPIFRRSFYIGVVVMVMLDIDLLMDLDLRKAFPKLFQGYPILKWRVIKETFFWGIIFFWMLGLGCFYLFLLPLSSLSF